MIRSGPPLLSEGVSSNLTGRYPIRDGRCGRRNLYVMQAPFGRVLQTQGPKGKMHQRSAQQPLRSGSRRRSMRMIQEAHEEVGPHCCRHVKWSADGQRPWITSRDYGLQPGC